MDVWDDPDKYHGKKVSEEAEKRFQDYYLRPLGDGVSYVRLESEFRLIFPGLHADVLRRNAHER